MSDKTAGSSPYPDARAQALHHWFASVLPTFTQDSLRSSTDTALLEPVSGDASFRRYFRGFDGEQSWILMDAPPALEDSRPFLHIALTLRKQGVNAPRIFASDLDLGFLCLEDFGSVLYLQSLQESGSEAADQLYTKALDELLKIQKLTPQALTLPLYDEALLQREMALFRDWFCQQLLTLPLSAAEESMMFETFDFLVASALSQQRVFVHRDYHSRNLMHCGDGPPGVLDFQDAVWGPATYDLVSLLKDCYIAWPRNKVLAWVNWYQQRAEAAGVIPVLSTETFLHDFDLMGVQRHLKAIGIFSRLKLRDGKTGYLKDIPRTLEYILVLEGLYPELDPFIRWCREKIVPLLPEKLNLAGARA